jgi:hypothetical protein
VEPGLLDIDTSGVMEKKESMFCTALNSGNNYIKFILGVFRTKQEKINQPVANFL